MATVNAQSESFSREKRAQLIKNMETQRGSDLITYIHSDRPPVPGSIDENDLRPMYEHMLLMGQTDSRARCLDLFLYSRGGAVAVPWKLVSMIREFYSEFRVLVPYKAHSAATMITLGADSIVMCKKAELGPIDPTAQIVRVEQGRPVREEVSVEDIMSYLSFISERDRVGLKDQAALASALALLAQKVDPRVLGGVDRIYRHIRLVSNKLLEIRSSKTSGRSKRKIIESLAKEMYLHGHGIAREEAKGIGLPVEDHDDAVEQLIWNLYLCYEQLMKLTIPIDTKAAQVDPQTDELIEPGYIQACIESRNRLDVLRGNLRIRHIRRMPQQLNVPVTLNLSLPQASGSGAQAPTSQMQQQLLQQVAQQVGSIVRQQIVKVAPVERIDVDLLERYWQDATSEGI